MRGIICGALMALMIVAADAAEDYGSTNFLLPYCEMSNEQANKALISNFLRGRCMGLIEGIRHTLTVIRYTETSGGDARLGALWCTDIPTQVTNEQIIKVIAKYAEGHPAVTRHSIALIAMTAMNDAWPCQKRAPQSEGQVLR